MSLEDAAHQHSATAAMASHGPHSTFHMAKKCVECRINVPPPFPPKISCGPLFPPKICVEFYVPPFHHTRIINNHASCNCNRTQRPRANQSKSQHRDECKMQAPLTTSPDHQAPDARSSPLLVPAYCYRIYRSASSNDVNVK